MEINIVLPSFVNEERDIHIFWGKEVVARKMRGEPWEIKVIRCNFCGECCRNVGENWFFGTKKTGECVYLGEFERVHHADERLEKGYFCKIRGDKKPFSCCRGRGAPKECVISFKKV